ncbi:MAG: L,D-transpeptidase family protein [Silvanigrellales bacterium]|nr:L,D-transpeptidase family protein [Silvanigrellales bacterium]
MAKCLSRGRTKRTRGRFRAVLPLMAALFWVAPASRSLAESALAPTSDFQASASIGPSEPIGPSFKSPEVRKRLDDLVTRANDVRKRPAKPSRNLRASTSVNIASSSSMANGNNSISGAGSSHAAGGVPGDPTTGAGASAQGALPPLVGGNYGFSAPTKFDGTPKSFVSLGGVSPAFGIVVEKLHHRLSLFRLREDGKYEVLKTYRAITGKDPEDKKTVGDLRTPEGIYFVTGRIDDKDLPAKYGRAAFTLDYPNIFDQRQRKSGYGIWVHATDDPKRLLNPFDTEGCVVVSNEDLLELERFLGAFEVPIVITKEMVRVDDKDIETPRAKANEMIEAWRQAWENSNFEDYMGFYSKNFRSLGKSKEGWQKYKQSISSTRKGDIKVEISEPKILAFEDQLLVVFQQDYSSKVHNDYGRKFLYLQWEGDRYRIIAEKWYREKKTSTAERSFKPVNRAM